MKQDLGWASIAAWVLFFSLPPISAQTTQGLISGQVLDQQTGRPVADTTVDYFSLATNASGSTHTDNGGNYYLPQLSPGLYRIRVVSAKYQAQEVHELELRVAGRIELDFRLRPISDVWEAGRYRSVFLPGSNLEVTFYGPDVDTSRSAILEGNHGTAGALESTISQVVDPEQIIDLPLAGRDVYTMLVTQAGVTADTTTVRSLGLSVNGQRPSASNFLLDGLESNNYLVSGPLSPIAPEAIQEYRVSTNNFSAEYGGTSGYIANAVTRAGTNQWRGLAYADLKNGSLNANDFQSNLAGLPRPPVKEVEPGVQVGGPIRPETLFVSGTYDYLRSRSRLPTRLYRLPTTGFLQATAPDSIARKLLTEFPGPATPGPGLTALVRVAPPESVDRSIALARADRIFSGGAHHLMGRLAVTDTSRPDYKWTPYKDFISGIGENTYSLALSLESALRPALINEFRFGASLDDFNLGRPHGEIPLLTSSDGTTLPGSPVFSRFQNSVRSWQALDNLTWARGRQIITLGGGVLLRGISGTLTAGDNGQYNFATIADFATDHPTLFRAPLDRQALPTFVLPGFDRKYRSRQFSLFAQNTFKVTPHLVVNYGLRYESYGAPVNVGGVKDALVELGSGAGITTRLATAQLVRPGGGDESLYAADHNDWAPRVGFSYSPSSKAGAVIRGAYGIFYDRIFDNAWENIRNNSFVLPAAFSIASPRTDYLTPAASVVPSYQGLPVVSLFPDPVVQSTRAPTVMFQPGFRSPRVQSFFLGFQQPLGGDWSAEAYSFGSLGRRLLTTDSVNRAAASVAGPIQYRANQGSSSYNALSTVVHYRGEWAQFQAAYTWSHAIDNQSEVLRGDYFNLSATRLTAPQVNATVTALISAFTRQFDSSIDRANSDFDQRHNLVFFSIVDLPRWRTASKAGYLFRDWKLSQLAAFRSGVPFTVYTPRSPDASILNQRADLITPEALYLGAGTDVPGGKRLLNPAAFAVPAAGQVGNTGRNAFQGPGFYNIDISLSRSFPAPWLGEAGRISLRADGFNFLNHANLNLPNAVITLSNFGTARYGRAGPSAGLPVLSPVNDTSRQIQLIFRVQF